MILFKDCPSYGQCSCWPWLSSTLSCHLLFFSSGLAPVSLSCWGATEALQIGVPSAVPPFEEWPSKPGWKQSPILVVHLPLFSLRSAACLCILYTAPECLLNSLEVGHFCRALKLFLLYSVRQRKPLLHCIMPALNQHCCFLWEIKQRFISPLQVFYAATKPGFQIWAWLGFDGFSAQHGHWTPPVCFWSDFTALRYKVLKW